MHSLSIPGACLYFVKPGYSTPRVLHYGLPLRKPLTTSSARFKKSKSESDSDEAGETGTPKVKWYQQMFPWSSKRTATDGEFGFTAAEDYNEAKWLKGLKDKYDTELRDMEGQGGKTLVEPLLATLPEKDAQAVRAEIRKSDLEEARKERVAAAWARKMAEMLPKKEELEVQWRLPPNLNTYLKHLNEMIFKASRDIGSKDARRKLWLSYIRCKAFLPSFLHHIPRKFWDVLWASQQNATPDDPRWASRMITVSADILEAGETLNVYQKILRIEALNIENNQEKAFEEWATLKDHLGDNKRASEEYDLLGIRLFTSRGDPGKAERIALNFLSKDKQEESRILIPVLHAWAQRGEKNGIEHAWALYLQFRAFMGASISMDDYDRISMVFLDTGRTDVALAVFKDLMLTGQQTDEGSTELYKKSLGMVGKTQPSAVTVEDVNRISLAELTPLPTRFNNKFFYGCWLKKLLGMGAVDAASQVVELMYERGVKPDPRHLNGMIGARLRSGTDSDRRAAEQMAWAMIYERLDFVKMRQHLHKPHFSSLRLNSDNELIVPDHLRQIVAPANVETFSLLLQHYGRRSQYENVQSVQDILELAEIQPNIDFINSLLSIDIHRGQHAAAWTKFREMFGTIKPDLETFACLWNCEKAHLDNLIRHSRDGFPGPRRIMFDMMHWFSSLGTRGGKRESVQGDFTRDLYEQIIHCFCLASDPEGIMVAMHGMKESFGFYPDPAIMRVISDQVSRMKFGEQRYATKAGRFRNGRGQRHANSNKIAQLLAIAIQQRESILAQNGLYDLAQFDDDVVKEETLFRLTDFLKVVLLRTNSDVDSVEGKVEKAASDMGVNGLRMEDPLPSYRARKEIYRVGNGS